HQSRPGHRTPEELSSRWASEHCGPPGRTRNRDPTDIERRRLPRRERIDRPSGLRSLERRTVSSTPADGNILERATVLSAGRAVIATVRLDVKGVDVFIVTPTSFTFSDPPTTRRLIEMQLHSYITERSQRQIRSTSSTRLSRTVQLQTVPIVAH